MGWLYRLGAALMYTLAFVVLFLVVGYVFRIPEDFVGLLNVPGTVVIFAFLLSLLPDEDSPGPRKGEAHQKPEAEKGPAHDGHSHDGHHH